MHILAIIAPNGLGHYRRAVHVLDRLAARLPDARIDLVCERWQLERGSFAAATRVRARGRAITGVMVPGVEWAGRARGFADGRLLGWLDRLAALPEVASADLVVSDNLGGVLALRPDAVLMGSHLWSDVLAEVAASDDGARAFVQHERALLERLRPPMLCVADMVMPGVREHTRAIELGWMCDEDAAGALAEAAPQHGRVAVLGGATGAADDVLARIEAALRADGRWNLVGAREFGHELADFAACAAVVCRPGVGTLTECVTVGTPMLWVYEADNVELAWNARACAALGLGRDLGAEPDPANAAAALAALLAEPEVGAMRGRLLARARDGLDAAAAWLATHATRGAHATAPAHLMERTSS